MSKLSSIILASLVAFSMSYPFINQYDVFIEYDLDDANAVWDAYDSHVYVKRTTPDGNSIQRGIDLIENNSIFIMRFWEPFVYDGEIKWDEDPFDDWTWQFYFHSLRMVSHLINAYELSNNITFLAKAQWFIESWMDANPHPNNQMSERAWDDHSTANRISTMIYFWDHYRDSEIFDETFANELLNMLRKHGEYTASGANYFWGHNHGIYQDRALLQLAGIFPHFKDSADWEQTANKRLATHIEEGVTTSGVHKEHSPAYHYLVMKLFIDINLFNQHYGIENQKITDLVYSMQEYLVHVAKPDGTVPMVGDSFDDKVIGMSKDFVTNEHLLYEVTNGQEGVEIEQHSIVYYDAGVAIFKNDWDNQTELYFALFNAFHSDVHKQSDDLSFVLTYGNTDYFVDTGKYNFVEKDPYRVFIRSVFSHNTISVDNQTYDFRNLLFVDNPQIEKYEINENYSYVRASHTIFSGVEITRTAIVFNGGAMYLHDQINSQTSHSYSQIFNIGPDVNFNQTSDGGLELSSMIDDTSLTLTQLSNFDGFETFYGSEAPIRGWQSTTFNEVSPIHSVHYYANGDSVSFNTVINMDLEITSVEVLDDENSNFYTFDFENQQSISIEI